MQESNHKAETEQKSNNKQTLLTKPVSEKLNQFYSDICTSLVAANIPWNVMEKTSLNICCKILQLIHSI
jgi:hypothetical protein